ARSTGACVGVWGTGRSHGPPGSPGTRPSTRCSTSTAGRRTSTSRCMTTPSEPAAQSGPAARSDTRQAVEATVTSYLQRAEIEHEAGARPGEFVVVLPGERKLRTAVSLLVGDHSLSASAFVVRHEDEEHEQVYRWLLERNARLPGIAFALDGAGDVYLVG